MKPLEISRKYFVNFVIIRNRLIRSATQTADTTAYNQSMSIQKKEIFDHLRNSYEKKKAL